MGDVAGQKEAGASPGNSATFDLRYCGANVADPLQPVAGVQQPSAHLRRTVMNRSPRPSPRNYGLKGLEQAPSAVGASDREEGVLCSFQTGYAWMHWRCIRRKHSKVLRRGDGQEGRRLATGWYSNRTAAEVRT